LTITKPVEMHDPRNGRIMHFHKPNGKGETMVLLNWLLKAQRLFMFLSCLLITIGLSITVFFRYVFKLDVFGIEELQLIPTFLLYFLGAAYASYERSHITADMVDSFVKSEKAKQSIRTLNAIVTLVVSLIFTYWTIKHFIWSYETRGTTAAWKLPVFIPYGIVMLGFVFISLYSVMHMVKQAGTLLKKAGDR